LCANLQSTLMVEYQLAWPFPWQTIFVPSSIFDDPGGEL